MFAHGQAQRNAGALFCLFLLLTVSGCGGDVQANKSTHLQRGDAYFADGKYAEAVIEFKNAVQLDAQDPHAHYKLGLAYLKKGGLPNLQKAFQEFKRATDLDANMRDAQLKLGELYLLSQRFPEAQESRRTRAQGNPGQPRSPYVIRECLCRPTKAEPGD